MRCAAFAVPCRLESVPGIYPLDLSQWPTEFTLNEFVAWYWLVRTWKVRVAFHLEIQYTDVASLPQTFDYIRDVEFSLNPVNVGQNDSENQRVVSAEYFRYNNLPLAGAPYFLYQDNYNDAFDVYFGHFILHGGTDPGDSNRGFWTGSHDGAAGTVIPRMTFEFDAAGPAESPADLALSFSGSSVAFTPPAVTPPDPDWITQTETNALSFQGKTTSIQWAMTGGRAFDGTPSITGYTMHYFTIDVTPASYFEFSDGVTPVYNATTGAQLINPLTASV